MAQIRWWNFKDDDSTFRLNERDLTLMPEGLYAGFDLSSKASFTLTFNGSITGASKSDINGDITTGLSIWRTKQGGIIQEDGEISIIAQNNPSTQYPRYDAVVGVHNYVATVGGTTATYEIVIGTASATPTLPTVSEYNKTIIGYLWQPLSNNDSTLIEFIPNTPRFSDTINSPLSNQVNDFEFRQVIPSLRSDWGEAELDDTEDPPYTVLRIDRLLSENRFVAFNALRKNYEKTYFQITKYKASEAHIPLIMQGFIEPVADLGNEYNAFSWDNTKQTREWTFYTERDLIILCNSQSTSQHNISYGDVSTFGDEVEIFVPAFSCFTLLKLRGAPVFSDYQQRYLLKSGGEVRQGFQNNKSSLTIGNYPPITSAAQSKLIAFMGTNEIYFDISPSTNFFFLISTGSSSVGMIESFDTLGGAKLGTIIEIINSTSQDIILQNKATASGSNNRPYKNIRITQNVDIIIPDGATMRFYEAETEWMLINSYDFNSTTLSVSNGDLTFARDYYIGDISLTMLNGTHVLVEAKVTINSASAQGIGSNIINIPVPFQPTDDYTEDILNNGVSVPSYTTIACAYGCRMIVSNRIDVYTSNSFNFNTVAGNTQVLSPPLGTDTGVGQGGLDYNFVYKLR